MTAGLMSAMAAISAAHAQEGIKPGEETLQISVGAFFPRYDTDLRVNVTGVGGGGVDLEDDLGFDDDDVVPTARLRWRIAPRHRLSLGYYVGSERTASFTAERDIEIGEGEIIAAGADVDAKFEFRVFPITYQYSFIKTPRHEFAGSFGLHVGHLDFSVAATAWADDVRAKGRVEADTYVPIPMVGLAYDFWITDRWALNTRAEVFNIDFSTGGYDFSGTAYDASLGTEYWIWNNLGVAATLSAFSVDVKISNSDWRGSADLDFWGPGVYVIARF